MSLPKIPGIRLFSSRMNQPIEYSVCTARDTDEMAQMLGETFSRREPPAVALGITAAEFETFVQLLCPTVIAEELTIVARRVDTGEMIGALLTEDSASALPHGMDALSSKFDPIFDILGQLDAEYRGGHAVRPGESIHLYLLGVAESATGQGVAKHLVARCLETGARKGYRVAVTEATTKVSQHVFRRLGFRERVYGSYEQHRFDGRAVFASIAEHGGPILMDRSLAFGEGGGA
jgi:GNAT superfamily N-acetyltransferase